jgi:hypothetical protein
LEPVSSFHGYVTKKRTTTAAPTIPATTASHVRNVTI